MAIDDIHYFGLVTEFICSKKYWDISQTDESIRDTLIDLANYAIICAILYDETKEKESNDT